MSQKLIQIFLPLYDNVGKSFPPDEYKHIQLLLTEKFNGVTVYQRAPAKGLWKEDETSIVRDDLVIYEVVAETLEQSFWTALKDRLLKQFRQEAIMIRCAEIQLL
jgi:hypothetical protein